MFCNECGGSGWIQRKDESGYSYAQRCGCSLRQRNKNAPPSEGCVAAADIILANCRGAGVLKTAVAAWIAGNIETEEELGRFVAHALENMTEWGGIGGLRLLLDNLRGKDRLERQAIESDRKLAAWKAEAQAQIAGDVPLPPLPEPKPKRMPKAKPLPLPPGPTTPELEEQLAKGLAKLLPPCEEERERKAAELAAAVRARGLTRAS